MTGASIVASPDPVFNPPKHSSPITGNMNTAQAHTTPRARTSTKSSNSTTPSVSSGRRGSSTGQMQRKKCNMRTIIVNCNSIAGKKKSWDSPSPGLYCSWCSNIYRNQATVGSDIACSEFMPQGYNCFRKDHKAGGGRVMIAIKSCYPASDVESNSELVCASISMRGERKTVIGSFYRPPDQGQEPLDDLDKALKDLSRKYKNQNTTLIIGGDFNTGCINWEILPGCPNIAVHEKLVSILADHHLYQMQRLPTLLDRILDLFCVNNQEYCVTPPPSLEYPTMRS